MRAEDDFAELWREHHRRVHAYALRRTDPASAQDIVSETFLVAWRRQADMPVEPLPWLIGVARHVLANHARSHRRQAALAQVLVAQSTAHTEGPEAVDRELLEALAALGEADREVLLLTSWDGLTTAEAARVLGCAPTACRVRLMRARRRLGERLRERGRVAVTPTPERSAA